MRRFVFCVSRLAFRLTVICTTSFLVFDLGVPGGRAIRGGVHNGVHLYGYDIIVEGMRNPFLVSAGLEDWPVVITAVHLVISTVTLPRLPSQDVCLFLKPERDKIEKGGRRLPDRMETNETLHQTGIVRRKSK